MHAGDHLFIATIAIVCSAFAYSAWRVSCTIWLASQFSLSRTKSLAARTLSVFVFTTALSICLTLLKTSSAIIPSSTSLEFVMSILGFVTMVFFWFALEKISPNTAIRFAIGETTTVNRRPPLPPHPSPLSPQPPLRVGSMPNLGKRKELTLIERTKTPNPLPVTPTGKKLQALKSRCP